MDPITIGLLAGGAQGLLNWGQSITNTNLTRQANMELAEFGFQKNLDMWNRQNAYNHPSSQMERLKQAGLNPNLVYGNGVVGNSAGTMPQYQTPRVQYDAPAPVQIPQMISAYQDFRLKQAQTSNVEDQNEAIRVGIENARAHGKILGERLPGETYRSQLAGLDWSRQNATQEEAIKYLMLKYQLGGEILGYQRDASRLNADRVQQAINKAKQDIAYSRTAQDKMVQDIAYSKTAQAKLEADTQYTRGRTNMLPRVLESVNQEIKLKEATEKLRRLDIDTYMEKMYADWAFKGLGAMTDAVKAVRGIGGKGQAPTGGVNPADKSWQKGKETYKEWMQRVNPGAN